MSSNIYKNLFSLISTLSNGLKNLEKGELKPEQITLLLDDARSLHERLAVLQYLSFKKNVNSEKKEKKVKKKDKNIQIKFGSKDLSDTNDNQINLLDVIDEEAEKTDPEVSDRVSGNTISKTTNFSSINERFTKADSISIGDKMRKQPINDLIHAIGINEKFLFINDLFKGDNNDYNSAISKLNSFKTFDEANVYINDFLKSKFHWKMKNSTEKKFLVLIERRYL